VSLEAARAVAAAFAGMDFASLPPHLIPMAGGRSAVTGEEAMTPETGAAETVAYALFERVCYAEGKDIGLGASPSKGERPSRSWIFSTYAECLAAVRSQSHHGSAHDMEPRLDPTGRRYVPPELIRASDPV
jgi:hypothetical protein